MTHRSKPSAIHLSVLVSVFFGVCLTLTTSAAADESALESTRAKGAALLQPFKRDLMAALREGLAKGPVEAVAACQIRAPEIARELSRDGVRVGRSSHRLRNPDNTAPDWVAPILADFLAHPENREARVSSLPDGRSGYVEPIALQPLCATCHGVSLTPALSARIEALYPEDRAVGFEVGDLRGVFWVELPAAE